MPELIAPPAHSVKSDIELFAKAYFNIEPTRLQLEVIDAISKGKTVVGGRRRLGLNTANRILRTYIAEGLKPGGRRRLPQVPLPDRYSRPKLKHLSQEGKVLALIKRPYGAFNFELAKYALKYTSVISELRKDGYSIVAERQYLKNGRASNTWKYYLIGRKSK